MSLSPSSSSEGNNKEIFCQWSNCYRTFDDVESLYNHLSADHVGRKSMGNLCLDCHWEDCDVKTTKRDHITSHLRVHVPLKPHVCQTCKKAFKRPQDLKKHYKIHTEEHQQHLNFMKCQRLSKKLCSPPSPPYCYPPHRQRKLNNPSSSILLSNPQQLGNNNNNNSKSNGDDDSNSNSNNDRNIVVPNHSINNNARLPSISSSFYFTPNNHNVPNIPSQHINNNNNNSNNKNNNISSSNDNNNIFNNNQNFIAWQL